MAFIKGRKQFAGRKKKVMKNSMNTRMIFYFNNYSYRACMVYSSSFCVCAEK